jgi:hypothetical protein
MTNYTSTTIRYVVFGGPNCVWFETNRRFPQNPRRYLPSLASLLKNPLGYLPDHPIFPFYVRSGGRARLDLQSNDPYRGAYWSQISDIWQSRKY